MSTELDTYETPDPVPAEETAEPIRTQPHEDIDAQSVKPGDAFKRFARSAVSFESSDFSDSVVATAKKSFPVSEDPFSRLRRLKREADEVAAEIERGSAGDGSGKQIDPSAAADAVKQLADLRKKLSALRPSQAVATAAAAESETLTQRLLAAVTGTQTQAPAAGTATPAAAAGTAASGAYEVYIDAVQRGASRTTELDARLAALEQRVGAPKVTTGQPFAERLQRLEQRLRVLDTGALDAIAARVQQLNTQMATVAAKRTDDTLRAKTDELLSLIERWEPMAAQLPTVVDRLRTLKSLHEDMAQMSSTAHALSEAQTGIAAAQGKHERLLAALEESLASNAQIIKSNVEALDGRMAALAAKIQALPVSK